MTPPPLPQPLGGATGRVPSGAHRKLGRRRSGFWFGVGFALLAVVGLRYLIAWADGKGYLARFGIGGGAVENRAAPTVGPTAAQGPPAAGPAPAPTPAPPTTAPVTDAALAGPAPGAAPTKPPVAEGTTADAGGKAPVVDDKGSEPSADKDAVKDKEGADKDKGKEGDKVAAKDDEEEPDEEALLRDAVPNAENAVIGEDEAEEVPARPPGRAGAKPPAPAKRPASTSRPAKVQTAILHITSAPKGAIVKTKARVLGRTPINLHFKTGNTYELVFVKRGYHPTTRKVAVEGTKDRKVAVTLKKRPPPKPAKKTSFFHPHR